MSQFNDVINVCADIGRTLLKTGGTYTIVVTGRGSATGDYGFMLQSRPLTASGTLACTKDQGDPGGTTGRDLNGYMWSDPAMTNTKCRNSCVSRGFAFAGTQYGSYCFCGNRYGQFGPATNCDMGCSGDNTEACGGSWANSVSRSGAEPTTPKSGLKNPTSP